MFATVEQPMDWFFRKVIVTTTTTTTTMMMLVLGLCLFKEEVCVFFFWRAKYQKKEKNISVLQKETGPLD